MDGAGQPMNDPSDSELNSPAGAARGDCGPSRSDFIALTDAINELIRHVADLNSNLASGRSGSLGPRIVRIGNLSLDALGHQIMLGDEEIELSAGEFRLLHRLISAFPDVVPFEELYSSARDGANSDRNLRVYVRRLRLKLESATTRWNGRILNVRGHGYRVVGP